MFLTIRSREDDSKVLRFFNGFCFWSDRSITDAKRDTDRKLTRLRNRAASGLLPPFLEAKRFVSQFGTWEARDQMVEATEGRLSLRIPKRRLALLLTPAWRPPLARRGNRIL